MDTKALRQKILDLAIRGKLVPQDPSDEPASVLLERIRAEKQKMVKEGKLKAKDIKNDSIIYVGEDNLHYEKFADGSVKCIEKEIPFDLPEGWAWARLKDIGKWKSGATPSRKCLEYYDGDIPWVKTGDLNDDYIRDVPEKISEKALKETSVSLIPGDTVLIAMYGATIGKLGITTCDVTTNQACCACCSLNGLSRDFLFYFLMQYKSEFVAMGVGGAQPNISKEKIVQVIVPIPPIEEQNRITAQISKLFACIEAIENDNSNLRFAIHQAKSKILDLAIRGKLVPQDPNDEPASVLLERIREEKEELIKAGKLKRDKKESVIFRGEDNSYYEKIGTTIKNIDKEIPFELPANWSFVRLKTLWELLSGRDLSPSEYNACRAGIPYITGASNFVNGKVELIRWTATPQVITEKGDLLLTCKGTVGETAFNDFGHAHIARQIMAIRNTFDLNVEYLTLCIRFYSSTIKDAAKGLIPGVSREDILNLILPVPPENYQVKVVKQIDALTRILSTIEKTIN